MPFAPTPFFYTGTLVSFSGPFSPFLELKKKMSKQDEKNAIQPTPPTPKGTMTR